MTAGATALVYQAFRKATISGVPNGAVAAGTAVTLHVTFSKSMTAGQDYKGELQLGSPAAPTLLSVPIVVHRR